MISIDLNADLGEGDAHDLELLQVVSSCNIACGGHAGDAASMTSTVRAAVKNGVAIGAHPSYPDREGFGRRSGYVSGDALHDSLQQQVAALRAIAAAEGARLRHVKPHGALYNDAARDPDLAAIVAAAAAATDDTPILVGPPGSALETAARDAGVAFLAEAFVDRAYRADGSLLPRSEPGAVHAELNTITTQAVQLATNHSVVAQSGEELAIRADTLCIHGDTDRAAEAARAVRDVLVANGIEIRAAG